jgi:hypothetical protein
VGRQSAGNILAMGRCSCSFVVCVVWKVAGSRSVGGRSVEESLQRCRQRSLANSRFNDCCLSSIDESTSISSTDES